MGPVSISNKTSYVKVSWSLQAARFVFTIARSLWNLAGTSAALLPMCLSNFKAMRWFKLSISRLRDFTRSYHKTSYRILKVVPGVLYRLLTWRWIDCSYSWCLCPWPRVTAVTFTQSGDVIDHDLHLKSYQIRGVFELGQVWRLRLYLDECCCFSYFYIHVLPHSGIW